MQLFDYNSKLQIVNQMIMTGKTNAKSISETDEVYLNAYNLIIDFTNELTDSPLTLGQRIDILYGIINNKTTLEVLKYISKNLSHKAFKKVSSNKFYSEIFSKMIDAFLICERDSESFNKLADVMHHNIYLYDLNSIEFVLTYPEILKKIYDNDLEGALKDICETLGNGIDYSTDLTSCLAKLLTYLSAALELPDVYLYSKKLNLDLSIMNKDYFVASGIIKDLEYMNYNTSDMKYYKALIKQKGSENVLKYKLH